jgi:prophage antirepressor-like protein
LFVSDLEVFRGHVVRFVGTADKPEWVAADVVNVLYPSAVANKNQSTYLAKVPDEWKGSKPVATPGGTQDMVTLFEPGMYHLIGRSDSPLAVSFQRWVFEEVLPTIRKTGYYAPSSGRHLPPALEERRARLEIIDLGMELLSQLGGLDERTELQFKDLVRDIVLADRLDKPALPDGQPERLEYPISDRVIDLGYGVQNGSILKAIGLIASNLYMARYGVRPPQREQFVDGTTRMVRLYGKDDLDIVDEAIRRKLGEPPA